jgi:hypothetical protein
MSGFHFAKKSSFSANSAPASKDDSSFYANLYIAAGSGAPGAFGLDGKLALFNVPLLGGALTLASVTANTGNNTSKISGQTYTDTIDWLLPVSWAFSLWKTTPTTLILTASPKYETDYKFDRKNFLFSGDSQWTASKLYQPQNYRTVSKDGKLPKYGDDGYATYGYGLEYDAGVGVGKALVDTTQKASSGSATIVVPVYSIARVVPQIHALAQRSLGPAGLITFDSQLTSRYLVDTEDTVREHKDHSLELIPISGWKALHTLTTTWTPPKSSNVGLSVTYKDGFDAPKFARVNSVLIGVLIKF